MTTKLFLIKLFSLFFLSTLAGSLFSTTAHACALGQTPFFKVDGTIANYYSLMLVSTALDTKFNFPQDTAPRNYLVNESIDFEVDKSLAPFSAEVMKHVSLDWDFGDGTKGKGFQNSHRYQKQGSYILSITAQSTTKDFDPYLLESIMVNIVPNQEYQLPTAIIKVNDQQANDPYNDVIKADWTKVHFDASASTQGSGKIVSYAWDFGDQHYGDQALLDHEYDPNLAALVVFPILRIKDNNGFIADAFVQVGNEATYKDLNFSPGGTINNPPKPTLQSSNETQTQPHHKNEAMIGGAIGIIVLAILGLSWYITRKN